MGRAFLNSLPRTPVMVRKQAVTITPVDHVKNDIKACCSGTNVRRLFIPEGSEHQVFIYARYQRTLWKVQIDD